MKILELSEFYSNYTGNFIPSLARLEEIGGTLGHTFIFVLSNRNMTPLFLNWEKEFEKRHKTLLINFQSNTFVQEIVKLIREEKIDIVHGHFLSSARFSEIKKKSPKHVVFFQHIHNSTYLKKDVFAWMKRVRNYFFLSHDIPKICCSESIAPTVSYTFPKSRILYCKNAIDTGRLTRAKRNNHDSFSVLLMGHNYEIKGDSLAIQAINCLPEEIKPHLDIVMGDRLEENVARIHEEFGGMPERVSILKPTQEIAKLYQAHQVFLNASKEEGMSYANIEAYYCGALFVCSDIPQNKEPNLPGALYFKCGDIGDLTRALLDAYKMRDAYQNDPAYVEEHFSLDAWAKEILRIFGLR